MVDLKACIGCKDSIGLYLTSLDILEIELQNYMYKGQVDAGNIYTGENIKYAWNRHTNVNLFCNRARSEIIL